jgi:hypothetical protein
MTDPATIGAIVVSLISAVGALIASWHIRKCKNAVCEVDCSKEDNSPRSSLKKTDSGKL